MSSIASFEAAKKLVTQPGSLLEVGQVGCWRADTVKLSIWYTLMNA
jgi:hypothetical protein